ncbi:MAG: hypothetical protein Q7R33_04740 [Nitrosarchaeum sp.]|nr:hypothetical protein [Nitrosarchaeum sp.]
MSSIIKFIKHHFFLKYKNSIGLNSVKLKQTWFINHKYEDKFNEIFEKTSFLENVSLSERIYCIIHDIIKKENCPYCDKYVRYANFIEGYRRHCGDRCCSYKDKSVHIDETGLTANEKSAIGISLAQNKIQQNGKTKAQNSQIKIIKRKRMTFINGKNMLQIAAEKAAATKSTTIVNGLNLSELGSLKAARTMETKLNEQGQTIKQQRIESMMISKSKVGKDGLDGFERAFLHGAGKNSSIKYFDTDLYYQGTYEKNFLDFMNSHNEIQNIKRGKRFTYFFNNHKRQYRTDFLYKNIIIEIKSSWTYGKSDKLPQRRIRNHTKFKSVIDSGHRLIVILDKNHFIEVTNDNLNKNLYNEKLEQLVNFFNILL